jgi:hypothetical protein
MLLILNGEMSAWLSASAASTSALRATADKQPMNTQGASEGG